MSKIEWTEQTWNPIIGCSKISDGCKNCYAEKMAVRLACIETTQHYKHVVSNNWNGTTYFNIPALEKPLKRKKPTTYFVCSMGDLFHESVPFEWVDKVLKIIEKCPKHRFIILTKRAERMYDYWKWVYDDAGLQFHDTVPSKDNNIIWGVTAENQEQANKRIPWLLKIPCGVRMVSCEPLLSNIIFSEEDSHEHYDYLTGRKFFNENQTYTQNNKIDWIIVGGESGSNARPMNPEWVKNIQVQCEISNTPFFFKQWGEHIKPEQMSENLYSEIDASVNLASAHYDDFYKVGKKKAGSLLDGKEYKQFPKILQI